MSGDAYRADVDIKAEGRAIAKAIRSILAKGKAAGYGNVNVYIECEGHVHLMNGDHPGDQDKGCAIRQDASIASALIDAQFDVGAW